MTKILPMLLVISELLLTSGIAADTTKPFTEEDKTTYTVSCSGTGKDWNDCYHEAETLCPGGYNIIKRSTGVVSAPINGRSTLAPSKKLIIECK